MKDRETLGRKAEGLLLKGETMRKVLFAAVLLFTSIAKAQTSYSRYDVNLDHEVNVTDVTKLVNVILGSEKSNRGDVNGDGAVNVSDVTALVDYILGKYVINGHAFVDLGLPSGTLWANQNMAADAPEEIGGYYAWGELDPKSDYTWSTYTMCNGIYDDLKWYNTDPDYGVVDGETELKEKDDVAHVQWGGLWQMPTKAQAQELKDLCTWSLDSARRGYVLTGPNGNTIFLPLSGYRDGEGYFNRTKSAYFWTSALSSTYPYNAYCLVFENSAFEKNILRCYGLPIRPVVM